MRAIIVLALLGLVVTACQPSFTADRVSQIQTGEQIYTVSCARCHEADGQGYPELFPALAGNHIVTLHDTRPLIEIVKHGRGSMPAFQNALDTDELAAVLTYIRNTWGNEASAIPPRHIR